MCALYARNHLLRYDERSVTVVDYLGRSLSFEYPEVERGRINTVSGNLNLWLVDGRKVTISPWLISYSYLAKALAARTPLQARELRSMW